MDEKQRIHVKLTKTKVYQMSVIVDKNSTQVMADAMEGALNMVRLCGVEAVETEEFICHPVKEQPQEGK